jgi:UTP-glucose-1-phosphate uridylyltransferase/mevalonate kinase
MKLFVPGRICLFGEHSDWAGSYRRINASIEKGYTIITGTNQGIYADVKPHPAKLIFRAALNDGSRPEPLEIPMDRQALLAAAEEGGFYSYVAGTAYQVLTHYRVHGLEIDNYLTDLPIKKGLSSSAALCVLVARAFNRIYDLKMTVRGEMEFAYRGEITTPSRCGRMDQGCAYGNRPIMMTYDGDLIDVQELTVPKDLHFVIVDLHASKNTKEILSKLNRSYPFADDDTQRGVQEYLGPVNARIVKQAARLIGEGDTGELGRLMGEAQREFDSHLTPACPSQLTAPVLHDLLAYEPLVPFVAGGKGVGSQGDGTAQFLANDEQSREKIIEIIERDKSMSCLRLTIHSARRVKKAVISAAGFGTRLYPATKAIRKELFPVFSPDGRMKPAMLTIVEEALSAGIEQLCIVIQPQDRDMFEDFFKSPPPVEHYNKLSKENQDYTQRLLDIGHRVTLITQDVQEGFGHAVYCTRDWVGQEPFLLLLGDHLYESTTDRSCSRQMVETYETVGQSVVGLKVTPADDIKLFGCVGGVWEEQDHLLSIAEFAEKPSVEYASKHLHVEGMGDTDYLTVFGQYILTPRIYTFLAEHIEHNLRERGEFQLTSCLDQLRQEEGFSGVLIRGRRYDIGVPDGYLRTIVEFGREPGSTAQ